MVYLVFSTTTKGPDMKKIANLTKLFSPLKAMLKATDDISVKIRGLGKKVTKKK